MVWQTPRNWDNDEVVDENILNIWIRDQQAALRTRQDGLVASQAELIAGVGADRFWWDEQYLPDDDLRIATSSWSVLGDVNVSVPFVADAVYRVNVMASSVTGNDGRALYMDLRIGSGAYFDKRDSGGGNVFRRPLGFQPSGGTHAETGFDVSFIISGISAGTKIVRPLVQVNSGNINIKRYSIIQLTAERMT